MVWRSASVSLRIMGGASLSWWGCVQGGRGWVIDSGGLDIYMEVYYSSSEDDGLCCPHCPFSLLRGILNASGMLFDLNFSMRWSSKA